MWAKLLQGLKRQSQEWNILHVIQELLGRPEKICSLTEDLSSKSKEDLLSTLSYLQSHIPTFRRNAFEEITHFQLCQRLVLSVHAFTKTKNKCKLCEKYYDIDFESSLAVKCAVCCIPSHEFCTANIYLPSGFYWKCSDCDASDSSNQYLPTIFQALNTNLKAENHDSKQNGSGVHVKLEPSPQDDIGDEHVDNDAISEDDDDDDDFVGEEDEENACFPQKGYLCDLCQFATFDLVQFQSHVDTEESQYVLVQESISSPSNSNLSCIKCGDQCQSWPVLFQHVTKYHSRPADFPHFGDMEWKYVMSGGNAKRSCGYCGSQYESIHSWIMHMKISMGEADELKDEKSPIEDFNDLKCNECTPQQSFKNFDALKIHISTFHRRNKRFLCAFCTFDGSTVKDLNQHIHQEHEGNFNKCNECEFETWAHSVLRRHINVKHRKIRSFTCKHCSYSAMTKSTLMAHINREHEVEDESQETFTKANNVQFKCCFCTFKTASKKSFHDHFDDSHEGNRSQCMECDFKAPVISHLRRHIDSVHRGLKKFPCDHCEHRATTKQGLERHVRVRHLDLKDLKCPHCEYKTSAPDALRSHARKYHDIDEPSSAPDVKEEDRKDQKKRVYFGNRTPIPSICRLCGEAVPTTNKLAAHFAECHPFEKPFWCHQCKIGYETYYGIQNHNRKDHSEERHLCPICGYSTHGPQYLKRHYRRKHPHMFEALNAQQKSENQSEDKISADEKMKVALELKGLSDEEISERVKALIELSEDGVWTCGKCQRRFEGKPKRALYSHIRERHFHMRHFKCKECNFLSYNRAEIQEHKDKHKADKPIHQCDLCGFICDNSTGLIRHKRGRFCQNGHLQRRKRDREKMAKRMAMAFSAPYPSDSNESQVQSHSGSSPPPSQPQSQPQQPRYPYETQSLY